MGRKGGGRSGFMKAKRNAAESDEEQQQQEQAPAPTKAKPEEMPPQKSKASQFLKEEVPSLEAPSSPAPTQPTATTPPPTKTSVVDGDDDDNENNDDSEHSETRGHMIQRHKKEFKALKDQIKRLGKKGKDQVAKLEADLTTKHAAELASLPLSNEQDGADVVAVADSLYSVSLDGGAAAQDTGKDKKPSKAQKRREKLAKEEAERDARIAAELAELGETERVAEERQLKEFLHPMGLDIVDIPPDGHCLYRSLEHQLRHCSSSSSSLSDTLPNNTEKDFLSLRHLAAKTLRENADRYKPFLSEEDLGTTSEGDGEEGAYEAYCANIETTAAWGGHVEVQALAEALQAKITVYAVGMPVVEVGDSEEKKLKLCYMRHAYGLGEHYNSVVVVAEGGESSGSGEEEEEE
jgi:OTU domain-containing protein 6